MKTWITRKAAGVLALAVISLSACKKDEVQAILTPSSTAPSLTASTSSIVLQSANGTQSAVTYTWTPVTLAWSGIEGSTYTPAVTQSLQIDKKGNNFANPAVIDAGAGPTKAITHAALNTTLSNLGISPDVAADVEVRLKVTYANNVAPYYSPPVALKATPYSTILYVSSSYLNNSLTSAPKLAEIDGSPRQYQGYVYFGGTTPSTFKVTNIQAGTGAYYGNSSTTTIAAGTAGRATTGTLATTTAAAGTGFSIAPGFYLVKVNLADMTWTVTPYTWAIIGAATANGWNTETPMAYDATKGVWSVTLPLTAGEFKFRANGNWDVSLGNTNPASSYLTGTNGTNLTSPGADTYTVSLNLSDITKPTYTVSK
jgi:hypothetical protein